MPDLASLVAELGDALVPYDGGPAPATPVTGVHVSELVDPTPFLEGGELLLTTGMLLAGLGAPTRAYAARLRRRGIAGLGLGLGPVHDEVPAGLPEACAAEGLPLFLVPPATPFLSIARTYWGLLARTGEQRLSAALGAHRALVRAAASADPTRAVVHTLAGAVQGWAALLSRAGEVDAVWPESSRAVAEQAALEVARLRMAGPHSSATFPVGDDDVVLHPLAARGRATGFIATGCRRPMSHADRQTVLTASALLALQAEQQHRADAGARSLRAGAVRLLLSGESRAAATLLAGADLADLPAWVRLLAVDLGREGDEETVDGLDRLLAQPARRRSGRSGHTLPPLVLPRGAGLLAVVGAPPAAEALRDWLGEVAPRGRAIVSARVALDQVPRVAPALDDALEGLAPGAVQVAGSHAPGADPDGTVDLTPLLDYRRSDLTGAVTAYLRCRGRWEDAARELGVHRNTLRHRIGTARRVLDADLDDPDVAARLWLALRDAGLA